MIWQHGSLVICIKVRVLPMIIINVVATDVGAAKKKINSSIKNNKINQNPVAAED